MGAEDRRGVWAALAAFTIWGLMPLYWQLLKSVPSLQIVAHRIFWSTIATALWLNWKQGRGWLRALLAKPRQARLLVLSALCIGTNWGLYIWSVNAGHVVQGSLGYFINPLLSVVLGTLVLGERLRPVQWFSVGLAACGVLWLTFFYGSFPWIALSLALTFGSYGLLRKIAVVDAIEGLAFENLILLIPAIALLAQAEYQGLGMLGGAHSPGFSPGTIALLSLGGTLTALPLIAFSYSLRRVPLSTVGLLQYVSPTLQFLLGVLVFGEPFQRDRAIGFCVIWLALVIFALDGLRRSPAPLKPAPSHPQLETN